MFKTRSRFSSVLRRKPKVGSHPDPILCPTSPLICWPIISPTFSLWIFASEQHEIFCINHLGHVNCATRVGYSHKLRPLFFFISAHTWHNVEYLGLALSSAKYIYKVAVMFQLNQSCNFVIAKQMCVVRRPNLCKTRVQIYAIWKKATFIIYFISYTFHYQSC